MSPERHPGEARLFALANIKQVKCLDDATFHRDPDFSLQKFAERSFGVFQEKPQDIIWKFAPAVAEAVAEYEFHPSQSLEKQQDGSIVVRFRAGGMLEMCWHLYTWGANVEIVEPANLRKLMRSALKHRNFDITVE